VLQKVHFHERQEEKRIKKRFTSKIRGLETRVRQPLGFVEDLFS